MISFDLRNDNDQKWEDIFSEADSKSILKGLYSGLISVTADESDIEMKYGSHAVMLEILIWRYLRIKSSTSSQATPDILEKAYDLLESDYQVFAGLGNWSPEMDESEKLNLIAFKTMLDEKMIRGDAYPFQTETKIEEILGPFEAYFEKCFGLGPKRAAKFARASAMQIQSLISNISYDSQKMTVDLLRSKNRIFRINSTTIFSEMTSHEKLYDLIYSIELAKGVELEWAKVQLEPPLTDCEVAAIKNLLAVSKSGQQASSLNEVSLFPIIDLDDGSFILQTPANLMDRIWEFFEEAAYKDKAFYDKKFLKKRSTWTEEKAVSILQSVFGSDNVFHTLDYPDPSNAGMAELDIAVRYEPFLFLVEVKSNQFRKDGKLGNLGKLKSDLEANVSVPFEQAKRAHTYLNSLDHPVFVERYSGRRLEIDRKKFLKQFILTISFRHLAALASNPSQLKEIGLFSDGNYPTAICISDLEIISTFIKDPLILTHYFSQRFHVSHKLQNISGDEIDLLGAYLHNRLKSPLFTSDEAKNADSIVLSGFHSEIDDSFNSMEAGWGLKSVPFNIPDSIKDILETIRRRGYDTNGRLLGFRLLDLAEQTLIHIDAILQSLVLQKNIQPGRFRRTSFVEENCLFFLAAGNQVKTADSENYIINSTSRDMDLNRVDRGIGMTFMLVADRLLFECGTYIERQVPLAIMAKPLYVPGQNPYDSKILGKVGRNEPCPCGSTLKFKKCHGR